MNSLNANGTDLAYESSGGETDEAILLISGLGTQMIRWRSSFCGMLAKQGYRVIRFDNRDAGRSADFSHLGLPGYSSLMRQVTAGSRPNVPYTLADMANDAIGLLVALSIRQAHIVGRSM
jgi:pimeloyl-ACP methyl ester carboxylesterase